MDKRSWFVLKKYFNKILIEAGCDEAGRGCLAGPVYAAAVILPKKFKHELLNDSKQLNHQQREYLRLIIEANAISYAIGIVNVEEIDRINILNASFLAMHRAIAQLKVIPESLLIDGNRFNKYENIPHTCIIEGDGKYMSIAAASILAKTYRDKYMHELHESFPHYNWKNNKAYATQEHRDANIQHGITEHHRKSFTLLPEQLELSL